MVAAERGCSPAACGTPPRFGPPMYGRSQSDAMNIVVCVKQIPDPAEPGSLDPSTKTLKRSGKLILDESDSYGVEMALQLATAAGGGTVSLVSMAPNNEMSGLRTALAMGAADAILVSDPALQGTSALGTARVLAAAIARQSPDLVLTATESSDGYTGTVPTQVAELLGLPSVTVANSLTGTHAALHANPHTQAGLDDGTSPLTAVVALLAGDVQPRPPAFNGDDAAQA